MTQRNAPIKRGHRRALWLTIPIVIGLAACGGAGEEPVSAPLSDTSRPPAKTDSDRPRQRRRTSALMGRGCTQLPQRRHLRL